MKANTIYSKFKDIVELQPDAPAVIEDGRRVSFQGLDRMARTIEGHFPTREEASRERFIGIVMEHGAEMIAAMLAVLKSGAAYVPAEPSLPLERREYMMKAAGVDFIITDDFCRKALEEGNNENEVTADKDLSRPEGAAYVLFTSGTTGRPKGVIVENHSVVNYARAFHREFKTGAGDVMLQYSVCSFDIFVEEVFATLLNGGALAIPTREIREGNIDGVMEFVERHGVTEISGFPYLLAEMNEQETLPRSLRLLISGGDVLRESYIDRLREMGPKIYNTYGPSETTVCASYCRCDNIRALPDGTFPIGREILGVQITILDEDLKPVKPGRTGEICILGEGVGRGYAGNPPEQVNFVIDPTTGERMYRSGDLGYLLSNGNIAFLHRKDAQVMILGKRVEPGEVENILNSSPEVERGVVCPFADEKGLSYLVAYFVPRKKNFSLASIKHWLASKLTDFMVPEYFVAMRRIPVTVRGKVDRDALPVVLKEGGEFR